MKKQSLKKIFAFIITLLMFSVLTKQAVAQTTKDKKPSHGGSHGGGTFCNCSVRPIPFQCGQICGFFAGKIAAGNLLSISSINSTAISFELTETQNVSLKIYDVTGRLIKTLAQSRMTEGEHQIDWNKTDEAGNTVSAGIYIAKFDAGDYSTTKKLSVIR
jgi:hypothetical protein